jgi:hypothetical protein
MFVLTGSEPLTGWLAGSCDRSDSVKRAGSAEGNGSLAARLVHEWLATSRAFRLA